MASKKTKKSGGFSGKQVAVLAVSVGGIALVTFLIGYLSGKMYESSKPAETTEQMDSASQSAQAPKLLDPDQVKKETTSQKAQAEKFTFHEKLTEETSPADEPLKKSNGDMAPSFEEPVKKEEPVKEVKEEETPKKPKAKQKTAKAPAKTSTKKQPSRPVKPGQKLTLQVASFKSKKDAQNLQRKLGKKNHFAYVVPFKLKGQTWYRVRVGVFETQNAAKRTALKLEREYKLSTLMVTYKK